MKQRLWAPSARVYGLRTVVFRHSSIYGGRQFASFDQGWIGWFCQKALEQHNTQQRGVTPEPFTISGTGKQVRDVLHADDLIRLYKAAYQARDSISGEIFNIGGGLANSLSLRELFVHLADNLKISPLSYVQTARRASDQDFFVADIGKATKLLHWEPKVSVSTGLNLMLEWTERQCQKR